MRRTGSRNGLWPCWRSSNSLNHTKNTSADAFVALSVTATTVCRKYFEKWYRNVVIRRYKHLLCINLPIPPNSYWCQDQSNGPHLHALRASGQTPVHEDERTLATLEGIPLVMLKSQAEYRQRWASGCGSNVYPKEALQTDAWVGANYLLELPDEKLTEHRSACHFHQGGACSAYLFSISDYICSSSAYLTAQFSLQIA
jgi:hypothetical protein